MFGGRQRGRFIGGFLAVGAAFGAVFAGGTAAGWAAAEWTSPRSYARGGPLAAEAHDGGAGATCVDGLAMHANANLADEVHDYQQRFLAEERARQKSDELLAAKESAPPDHLATRASEWARLAREGRIRVRLPCASWESYGHSEVRSLHGGTFAVSGRRGDARQRALDAGLTDAEVEAIPETYDRARRRTWASIASTCEANEAFTSSVASMDIPADDLERRIRVCAAHVLRVYEEPTQRAIERVGELRAEGATIARAEGPEQRVLFGLTEASDHLTEELVRTFGREKATQVFDYGLVCTDEMVFKSRG